MIKRETSGKEITLFFFVCVCSIAAGVSRQMKPLLKKLKKHSKSFYAWV